MTSLIRLEELRNDARNHRERFDLYRGKTHGSGQTSHAQLMKLERSCVLSESRLRRAEQEQASEAVRLRDGPPGR